MVTISGRFGYRVFWKSVSPEILAYVSCLPAAGRDRTAAAARICQLQFAQLPPTPEAGDPAGLQSQPPSDSLQRLAHDDAISISPDHSGLKPAGLPSRGARCAQGRSISTFFISNRGDPLAPLRVAEGVTV